MRALLRGGGGAGTRTKNLVDGWSRFYNALRIPPRHARPSLVLVQLYWSYTSTQPPPPVGGGGGTTRPPSATLASPTRRRGPTLTSTPTNDYITVYLRQRKVHVFLCMHMCRYM